MNISEFTCLCLCLMVTNCRTNKFSVTLTFKCLENSDENYKTICDDKDCDMELELIVRYKRDVRAKMLGDIYKKIHTFKNVRGKCLNGIHDTRDVLKEPNVFLTTADDFIISINVKMISKEDGFHPIETQQSTVVPSLGKSTIRMDSSTALKNTKIKIELNLHITCLPNYYGNSCERYCTAVPSHFRCNETGLRDCLNGFKGPYCNQMEVCPHTGQCDCRNVTEGCSQSWVQCQDDIPICTINDTSCTIDLRTLKLNCTSKFISHESPTKAFGLHMYVTMPASVLGIIIVLLLVIIFIQGIYKKNARPSKLLEQRSEQIPLQRALPKRPPQISYIDDYEPPYSPYIDMRSQHQPQCPYSNSTLSVTQDDSLSTFSPYV